jgi:CHAD domain-containing protein
MGYRFDRGDGDLGSTLRRIAGEELDAALARLTAAGPPAATAVHEVRKHVKKLRALLRLVRPGFVGFRDETSVLRDAGRSLSGLRDAEVRLATFDRLTARDRPAHLADLRARLAAERDAAVAVPAATDTAAAALAAQRDRVRGWTLRGRDRALLIAGLADSRARACESMAEAQASRDIAALHDWRKRVKDGWYQARLLQPVWPAVMSPLADQAGLLAEDLGDHHDLAVLAGHLAALPAADPLAPAAAEAADLARAAMAVLEARIFPLGATLLAGKPEAVARLWAGWWQVWRAQPDPD